MAKFITKTLWNILAASTSLGHLIINFRVKRRQLMHLSFGALFMAIVSNCGCRLQSATPVSPISAEGEVEDIVRSNIGAADRGVNSRKSINENEAKEMRLKSSSNKSSSESEKRASLKRNVFLDVSLGPDHVCAINKNRNLLCWGWNNAGRVGDGTTGGIRTTPVNVVGVKEVVSIAAGVDHTCALKKTGHVLCWGRNDFGQLARSSPGYSNTPLLIDKIDQVEQLSAGHWITCATSKSRKAMCWGDSKELTRFGRPLKSRLEPIIIPEPSEVEQVTVGWNHACARLFVPSRITTSCC